MHKRLAAPSQETLTSVIQNKARIRLQELDIEIAKTVVVDELNKLTLACEACMNELSEPNKAVLNRVWKEVYKGALQQCVPNKEDPILGQILSTLSQIALFYKQTEGLPKYALILSSCLSAYNILDRPDISYDILKKHEKGIQKALNSLSKGGVESPLSTFYRMADQTRILYFLTEPSISQELIQISDQINQTRDPQFERLISLIDNCYQQLIQRAEDWEKIATLIEVLFVHIEEPLLRSFGNYLVKSNRETPQIMIKSMLDFLGNNFEVLPLRAYRKWTSALMGLPSIPEIWAPSIVFGFCYFKELLFSKDVEAFKKNLPSGFHKFFLALISQDQPLIQSEFVAILEKGSSEDPAAIALEKYFESMVYVMHKGTQDFSETIAALATCMLRFNPNHVGALETLGDYFYKTGYFLSAQKYTSRALLLGSNNEATVTTKIASGFFVALHLQDDSVQVCTSGTSADLFPTVELRAESASLRESEKINPLKDYVLSGAPSPEQELNKLVNMNSSHRDTVDLIISLRALLAYVPILGFRSWDEVVTAYRQIEPAVVPVQALEEPKKKTRSASGKKSKPLEVSLEPVSAAGGNTLKHSKLSAQDQRLQALYKRKHELSIRELIHTANEEFDARISIQDTGKGRHHWKIKFEEGGSIPMPTDKEKNLNAGTKTAIKNQILDHLGTLSSKSGN